MPERIQAFIDGIIKWRWLVLALSLALAGLAAWGAVHLKLSNDYRVFFSAQNPQLAAHDAIEGTYTKVDNVIFVVQGAEGDMFRPDRLAALKALTDGAWQLPYSLRVDSITNYQHMRAEGDDLIVADLVEDVDALGEADIARLRAVALSEKATRNRLISADGRTAAVSMTVQFPEGAENLQPLVANEARRLARRIEAEHPGTRVALSGVVMLSNAFEEAALHDIGTLIPLMGIFLALAMLYFLRSVTGALSAMAVVGLATASALGLAGWMGYQITSASGVAPVIILTIAIADSVHILATLFAEMRRGRPQHEAIAESLRLNMQPVFLTSATTAIGFLSLNFSDSPPFRDLGNICALGAILAWVYSVTFLPAVLAIVPLKPRGSSRLEESVIGRVVNLVVARPRAVVAALVLTGLFLAAFLPRLHINDKFVEFFAPGTEFRDDSDFISANLPGVYFMEFSVSAGEEGGITDPAYLERLDRFAEWLEAQPEVVHVNAFSDVMKRLNRSLNGDDPAYYRLPEASELAAQYLLLYEFSLPYGLDLNNQIDVAKSATRLTVILDNISSTGVKQVKARAEAWLRENTPEPMWATAGGVSVLFSFLTQRNIESMFVGTGLALVLISFCLVFALRSVKMGVVSLLPNLTPPVFAFGVWALIVGEVGLYASAVTAAALGLIVDFTVHFLSKYLRGRTEKGLGAEAGIRYAFESVGSALWISAFVLIAGFSALMLSDFVINSYLGMMTAMIIAIALVTDFTLLPAVLMTIERSRRRTHDENAHNA
ncbi:MAG: MMPL family transporter [Sphingomonadales bacterium]|nr:MMPL family transporter [Sphingomonadales bacterium]